MLFNEIRSLLNMTTPPSTIIGEIHTFLAQALDGPSESEMLNVWLPYVQEALKQPKFENCLHLLNLNTRFNGSDKSPLDILYNGYLWATPRAMRIMEIDLRQVKYLHCFPDLVEDLQELPNLQSLSFSFARPSRDTTPLSALPYMPKLRALSMGFYLLGEKAFATLAKSPLEIFITGAYLQKGDAFNEYTWPDLRELGVGPNFGPIAPALAAQIEKLTLHYPIHRDHALILREGSSWDQLEHVTLAYGGHDNAAVDALFDAFEECAPHLAYVNAYRARFDRRYPLIRRTKALGATFQELQPSS